MSTGWPCVSTRIGRSASAHNSCRSVVVSRCPSSACRISSWASSAHSSSSMAGRLLSESRVAGRRFTRCCVLATLPVSRRSYTVGWGGYADLAARGAGGGVLGGGAVERRAWLLVVGSAARQAQVERVAGHGEDEGPVAVLSGGAY